MPLSAPVLAFFSLSVSCFVRCAEYGSVEARGYGGRALLMYSVRQVGDWPLFESVTTGAQTHSSHDLANKRIWPAIDLNESSTRKEELLLSPETRGVAHKVRRALSTRPPDRAMQDLLEALVAHPDNARFVSQSRETVWR